MEGEVQEVEAVSLTQEMHQHHSSHRKPVTPMINRRPSNRGGQNCLYSPMPELLVIGRQEAPRRVWWHVTAVQERESRPEAVELPGRLHLHATPPSVPDRLQHGRLRSYLNHAVIWLRPQPLASHTLSIESQARSTTSARRVRFSMGSRLPYLFGQELIQPPDDQMYEGLGSHEPRAELMPLLRIAINAPEGFHHADPLRVVCYDLPMQEYCSNPVMLLRPRACTSTMVLCTEPPWISPLRTASLASTLDSPQMWLGGSLSLLGQHPRREPPDNDSSAVSYGSVCCPNQSVLASRAAKHAS
jgi:hypothetical protein